MSWHAIHPESFDPDCSGCLEGQRLIDEPTDREPSRIVALCCTAALVVMVLLAFAVRRG